MQYCTQLYVPCCCQYLWRQSEKPDWSPNTNTYFYILYVLYWAKLFSLWTILHIRRVGFFTYCLSGSGYSISLGFFSVVNFNEKLSSCFYEFIKQMWDWDNAETNSDLGLGFTLFVFIFLWNTIAYNIVLIKLSNAWEHPYSHIETFSNFSKSYISQQLIDWLG